MIAGLQEIAIDRIETARKKQIPTEEDLNPNTKFVRNAPLRILANSKNLQKASEELGVSWANNQEILRNMFRDLIEDEEYKKYMISEKRGFQHDKECLVRMFRKNLINQEPFQYMLEEESIFWMDDLDLTSSMVIKTLKSINESDDEVELLKVWRDDDDDKKFLEELLTETLAQDTRNESLIKEGAQNWEVERIALTDRILMKMALAEAKKFPTIPLKVTLNEYIELSKYYSTDKSHGFINGILDQLFKKLVKAGEIKKTGRGLL